MPNPIYPGIAGAPAFAGNGNFHHTPSNSAGSPSGGGTTPPSGTDDHPAPPADTGSDTGGSGLISVHGSNGGIDIHVVDTNGDGSGLIDVHSSVPGALVGGALDGTHIDVVNPDSLVDAHVPGVLDATVGDGTVADVVGGLTDGTGIGGIGGIGGLGTALQGIEVNALHDGNVLDAHVPGLVDATVGGSDLGGILGAIGDAAGGGLTGADGISVEALNGDNLAEVHAGNIADATVGGGSELGGLLGGISDTVSNVVQGTGQPQGLTVDVLNGEHLAEAHAPGTLDATIGGAELGSLLGGAELGGILGDAGLPLGGGDLLGNVLHLGSLGDIVGLDLGHAHDSTTG